MQKLSIQGGVPLSGEIRVSGAKNAALPILAAALLARTPLLVQNLPRLKDVETMLALLERMGVGVSREEGAARLDAGGAIEPIAPYELVKTMRASILALGPLVARFGEARVSLPGGCAIGERPVDLHLKGLEAMGATVGIEAGYIHATASRLRGARIFMDTVTVTGTENLMMAACLAEGETVLENSAREPEVVDLARCLVRMGARIRGHGTDVIVVEGVERLQGADYGVMPDRIEAGTFAVAAAMTAGDVRLHGAPVEVMDALWAKLTDAGATVTTEREGCVRVASDGHLRGVNFQALPYPGLATDLHAPLAAMLTQAHGVSIIHERVFDNRMLYVGELRKMGAEIVSTGSSAIVVGKAQLNGAHVRALDVRAGAAVLLAAFVAHGETIIDDVSHLDRGYEKLADKLRGLGVSIERQ